MCVQALYQGLLTHFDVLLETFIKANIVEKVDNNFVHKIYYGVKDNLYLLTHMISNALNRKKLEHIGILQQAILYAAAYEYYFDKLDKGILIKEYVTLTKRFTTAQEYKLIHACINNLSDPTYESEDYEDEDYEYSLSNESSLETDVVNNDKNIRYEKNSDDTSSYKSDSLYHNKNTTYTF